MAWRDLSAANSPIKKLRDCVPMFHADMGFGDSTKPAYFVGVYRGLLPTGKEIWYVEKQWSFVKDGGLKQGQTVGFHLSSIKEVYESLIDILKNKVSKGWKVVVVTVNSRNLTPAATELLDMVKTFIMRLNNFVDEGGVPSFLSPSELAVLLPKHSISVRKPLSDTFEELQRKRKLRSEW
jgi:hypothetical protein